jgi:hypothetical protein
MKPLPLAGASLVLTWAIAALAMPAAKPATASFASDDNQVVLHLPARDTGVPPPVIAGDFTNWMPVRMEHHKDEWRYSVHASPGVYHFAFRGADGHWFVPASFPNRTDDGMGGWVAVLVIP